jgi:hypothetical protein
MNDYWKGRFCKLVGHKPVATLFEGGNDECDCGADHTYLGCPRCGQNLEDWYDGD